MEDHPLDLLISVDTIGIRKVLDTPYFTVTAFNDPALGLELDEDELDDEAIALIPIIEYPLCQN